MKTIYDLTLSVRPGMPVWPGDPPVQLEQLESIDRGGHANVSRVDLSVHTGTHVDAPHHFLNDGRTVEGLSLQVLTGPARVVRLPEEVGLVTADVLAGAAIPPATPRLLLRTRNSALWARGEARFQKDFVALSPEGAEWLVANGVQLIGVDYLSVAPYRQGTATHRILLEAGVIIVEGLDLSAVEPGSYDLYCLPMKIAGSDGAPARVILMA